jgi:hypothetical protein
MERAKRYMDESPYQYSQTNRKYLLLTTQIPTGFQESTFKSICHAAKKADIRKSAFRINGTTPPKMVVLLQII